jgi:mannose-1-phosphate guanylyltransferase
MDIKVVIIAGGQGKRFWPVSRKETPKQILTLFGKQPLIEHTIRRVLPLVTTDSIYISTGAELQPKIMEIVSEVSRYIIEPTAKDTAAAIGLSAVRLSRDCPEGDAIMIVLPSDHYIENTEGFLDTIKTGIEFAKKDMLVTVGIRPSYPATGFGYVRPGNELKSEGIKVWKAEEFFEKPAEDTAKEFIQKGYMWNSGIFIWKCSAILNAIKKNLPEHYEGLMKIKQALDSDMEFSVIEEAFSTFEKISIDYGVMEKSSNVAIVEGAFDWDDVGSWKSIERHFPKDEQGNVAKGKYFGLESSGNIIIGTERLVATIGMKDIIIVDTKDALLIVPKSKAEDVKKLVDELEKNTSYKNLT